MDTFERQEIKYFVPVQLMEPLRRRLRQHMEHDPFCRDREGNRYPVHSIYFDTRRYLFYYEKISGLKVRKKLRVRAYDSTGKDGTAFLEIKRKRENIVYKDRARIRADETPNLLNGAELHLKDHNNLDHIQTLNKFVYLIKSLSLEPTTLIFYDREAFVSLDDSNFRVTLDINLGSRPNPAIETIYDLNDIKTTSSSTFILELKFHGQIPIWARNVLREFKLRPQPISKYCNGIDLWPTIKREARLTE